MFLLFLLPFILLRTTFALLFLASWFFKKKSLSPKIKILWNSTDYLLLQCYTILKMCFSITPSYTNLKVFTYPRSKLSLRSLCVNNQSRELSLCNINLAYCLFWKNLYCAVTANYICLGFFMPNFFTQLFQIVVVCLIILYKIWEKINNKDGKQCTSFIYSKLYF